MQSEDIKNKDDQIKGRHLKEEEAGSGGMQRPRRRKKGVANSVLALLVTLALICGVTVGYICGSMFSSTARKLSDAEDKIADYEMLMAEMYTQAFEEAAQTGLEGFEGEEEGNIAALSGNDITGATSEPVVVAEYDGGVIMSDEAQAEYDAELAEYVLKGDDVTDIGQILLSSVLENMVGDKVAYQKAEELGYTQLSDSDREKINELATQEYDETVLFYVDMVREDGMSEEEAIAAAQDYLELNEDYTLESVASQIEQDYWFSKLYDSITAQVTATTDDITEYYNARLAEQQAEFEGDHASFENALINGDLILYYPQGYRTVKHIFFGLDDESAQQAAQLRAQLAQTTDEAEIENINAQLDQIYAPLEEKAQDVYAQLEDGADFDQLMQDYSEDEELKAGYFADTGYYVAADSVMWSEDFTAAAMALELPGDTSEIVRTEGGVHIIRFIANVESGAVPLSQVSARMTADAQAQLKLEAFQTQLQTWIAEANAKYYPERMGIY